MTIEEMYRLAPHWRELVESKISSFSDYDKDLGDYSVELHNATWCPDCERESSSLLAFVEALGEKAPKLIIFGYEDVEHYKKLKASNQLSISCLPTIIFKDENMKTVLTIHEKAESSFGEVIRKI